MKKLFCIILCIATTGFGLSIYSDRDIERGAEWAARRAKEEPRIIYPVLPPLPPVEKKTDPILEKRTWTDVNGKRASGIFQSASLDAEGWLWVSIKIPVKRGNDMFINVRIDTLCPSDRVMVLEWWKKRD